MMKARLTKFTMVNDSYIILVRILSAYAVCRKWLETITHEDTVVCVLGEHESQSGEAASRAFLTLPEEQQVLFEKIAECTSNIVTVVIAGRPLDLRRISETCSRI